MPLPIPTPLAEGQTTGTSQPLYWCRYAPAAPRGRLLMLHGGPGAHHDYMLPQMLELATDRECIFYDQRGGGQSRTDDRTPITWHTHVVDLAAVVKELNPGPLTLVGYSWGGMLALLYCIEAAGRSLAGSGDAAVGRAFAGPVPDRLVLLDPAPLSRAWRTQFDSEFARRQRGPAIAKLREDLASSGLRESDPVAYRQRTFELSVAGYFADPARARDLTPFRVTGRVQKEVWDSLGDFDLIPSLRDLRIPTFVAHGRQDPIPLASSEAAATALAAKTLWLDDCGHVPYVERGDALFPALRLFLDDTESLVTH